MIRLGSPSNEFAPRNIARVSTEVDEGGEAKEGKELEAVVAEEKKEEVTDSNLGSRIART